MTDGVARVEWRRDSGGWSAGYRGRSLECAAAPDYGDWWWRVTRRFSSATDVGGRARTEAEAKRAAIETAEELER